MTHTVYRCESAAGETLYVGMSIMPLMRMFQHLYGKDWARQIACIKLEHFDGKDEAHAAEVAAIQSCKPRHNIRHNSASREPMRNPTQLRQALLKVENVSAFCRDHKLPRRTIARALKGDTTLRVGTLMRLDAALDRQRGVEETDRQILRSRAA
jgi:predicted GIY-YIG superfamily endonuclease